ncbi:unnamed protein product, partial [Scytosiphon promiscuus]
LRRWGVPLASSTRSSNGKGRGHAGKAPLLPLRAPAPAAGKQQTLLWSKRPCTIDRRSEARAKGVHRKKLSSKQQDGGVGDQ